MKKSGFIDLHIHGSGRYDTRSGGAEALLRLAALEGNNGTSAILPAIYPGALKTMRRQMEAVRKAMDQRGEGGAARILGLHLEGPFLNAARAGALNGRHFLRPTLSNLKNMVAGFEDIIKVITVAPEMPGALRVIERCASMGIRVHMGHSEATYAQALKGKKAGAAGVTHIFNAMRPMHHREPGLAGLGLMDEDLYAEVIADGVHLSEETLRLVFKVKRKSRILLVSDRVTGPQRNRGVLQGAAVSLAKGVSVLERAGIEPRWAVRAAKDNPKRYLGLT